tara:strand:+ start:11024 stop:11650 length:627 start_codon:yes stop_codon:yes gene_type:complete
MLTAMGDVMRKAYEKGWITTRDGNISLRRAGKASLYITPSGCRKTIIHPEHIIKIKINNDMLHVPKGSLPSGELEMHHKLQLLNRDKTQAIVHLHPTNIIAACFAGWDMQTLAEQFPEVSRYTRVGPTVPVLPVTSTELAIATFKAITSSNDPQGLVSEYPKNLSFDIVAQANHGVCAIGPNPWDAFEHIERLEHICEIALKSGKKPF